MQQNETNLEVMIKNMSPILNTGEFVFCTVTCIEDLDMNDILMFFREKERHTIIIEKTKAESKGLPYSFVASWITLTVNSSLNAVGLTAAFSKALSENGICCNVVAGFYHDHLFVNKDDGRKAIEVLDSLSKKR